MRGSRSAVTPGAMLDGGADGGVGGDLGAVDADFNGADDAVDASAALSAGDAMAIIERASWAAWGRRAGDGESRVFVCRGSHVESSKGSGMQVVQ